LSEKKLAPKNAARDKKPRLSLIPMDVLNEFMPPAYEEGLIKYERESWRRGFKVTEMVDSARRHLDDFSHKGENYDPGAAELGIIKHHLAGTIFSCIAALHTLKYHPELDDRFNPANGDPLTDKSKTTEDVMKNGEISLDTASLDCDPKFWSRNDIFG
jgi:hypothetical protein